MNVFDTLKRQGYLIDDGIKKLDKKWESPHNLLFHRGVNVTEAEEIVSDLLQPLTKIQNEMSKDVGPTVEDMKAMDHFLDQCTAACNEINQGVEDIETLFSEYGYVKPHPQVFKNEPDVDENVLDVNTLLPEKIENLKIDPSLNDQSDSSNDKYTPKFIATPVIKSVASVKQEKILKKHNIITPAKNYPQEPIFSPYYYKKV